MIKKLMALTLCGMAFGSLMNVFVCIIGVLVTGSEDFLTQTQTGYVSQAIIGMIVGIGWSVPALVYKIEKFSFKLKVLIHMGTGFVVFLPLATYAGWIPTQAGVGVAILSLVLMVAVAFIIWAGFYFYNKDQAKTINKKIKEISK